MNSYLRYIRCRVYSRCGHSARCSRSDQTGSPSIYWRSVINQSATSFTSGDGRGGANCLEKGEGGQWLTAPAWLCHALPDGPPDKLPSRGPRTHLTPTRQIPAGPGVHEIQLKQPRLFWSDMQRKPGETLQELVARIRQDTATCDFPSITDPLDENLRQRFICSVNNEAVLKAPFKVRDTDLTFACAVQVAIETEDAARVAKETVYGSKARPVNKVHQKQKKGPQQNHQQSRSKDQQKCYRCGKAHKAMHCPYKEAKRHFCDKKGHLKAVCQKKQRQEQGRSSNNPVKRITKAELVKQSSVKFLKILLGWMCLSQSRARMHHKVVQHYFQSCQWLRK